jgi:hypothetical protein
MVAQRVWVACYDKDENVKKLADEWVHQNSPF